MAEKLIGVVAAATELGIAPNTLRAWVDKGLVPCIITPTGYRRFTREQVERIKVGMGRPGPKPKEKDDE